MRGEQNKVRQVNSGGSDITPPPNKQSYCSRVSTATETCTIYTDHTHKYCTFSYTEASENTSMLVTVQWKVIRGRVAPKVKGVSLPWIPWAITATWEQTRCRQSSDRCKSGCRF